MHVSIERLKEHRHAIKYICTTGGETRGQHVRGKLSRGERTSMLGAGYEEELEDQHVRGRL